MREGGDSVEADPAEVLRLAELGALRILDTAAEERFDIITRLAAQMFDTPMSLVSLVDHSRQWFKSAVGIDVPELPRDTAFCAHAIREEHDLLVVPDATRDPRFAANPLVTGPMQIRFYAGAVLRGPGGLPVGTLCVLDRRAREPTAPELERLRQLARLVEWEMRQDVLIERLLREAEHTALFHPATGLPNRQHIFERLEQVLVAGEAGRVLVVLGRIDGLDGLSDVPEVADHLLRLLTPRLQHLDEGVEVGFWRQNQFLLFQARAPADGAPRLLERLRHAFREPLRLEDREYALTATVGVSQYPDDAGSARPLLQWARLAMPAASGLEPLSVGSYSHDLATRRARHQRVEQRLARAVAEQALSVVYQPVFEIGSRRLTGAEALVRWTDTELGSVSPAEFIPIAEESDLISGIGALVLGQVLRQIGDWHARGLRTVPISVNISSRQLRDPGFCASVEQALERAHLPGRLLQLEVTEHALINDVGAATATLRRVAGLGVTCAVDDFGVGYSSFNYLRRLPISTLKVDCEFIAEIDRNPRDQDIVRAIIAMAHALGVKVTAEGVETAGQLEVLHGLACDRVQGFLTGRGVPAELFEQHLGTMAALTP